MSYDFSKTSAMRPRSLYVAFDVFPRAKGSSSHIASMTQALARNFGSVRLLCLGHPELPRYQREGDIEICRFGERRRHLLRRATAFARFVAAHVRQLSGQLQLAVFRDPWGGYPLLRAGPGCPSIFEVNALPSWELGYSRADLAENFALIAKLRDMERECLRGCAKVLCVSSVTRRALAADGVSAEKIAVIPNVAHDVYFDAARQPCPIPGLSEGRWFGYIGGLQSWQGTDTILDAFGLVADDLPDCNLLIAPGDSRRGRADLERRIARRGLGRRIVISAPLAQDEVAGVLARLKFTVAPLADTPRNTHQGCCPVKMIESMACGTPVIASDLAVCREWMVHGREGLLVAPGDVRAWALAIRRLYRDGAACDRFGAAARRRAEEIFFWPVVHGSLDRVFRGN